jgi:hypothetical protein
MSVETMERRGPAPGQEAHPAKTFVPLQIGSATVYVEKIGDVLCEAEDGAIRPVAAPDPREAFHRAGEALQECVRTLGERVRALPAHGSPQEVTVEFTLTFEAGARGLIPVFLTAEQKVQTGLKVTAKWTRQEIKSAASGEPQVKAGAGVETGGPERATDGEP